MRKACWKWFTDRGYKRALPLEGSLILGRKVHQNGVFFKSYIFSDSLHKVGLLIVKELCLAAEQRCRI